MSQKLNGQVAVVTGASKGIGAEIAYELAQAGASVVVNYSSSKAGADKVVSRIKEAGGKAVAVQADVSQPEQIERLFTETVTAFGRVDVLVNNAGIYEFSPLEQITPEHFHKQFNLNVLGLILSTQAAAKHMGKDGGRIINVGSVAGKLGIPGGSVYSGTKAAVDAVTRALAAELGPRNIRVNTVGPGMVETEGVQAAGISGSDFEKQVIATTPLGRIGQPKDIAPLVAFLASSDSSWLSGETIYVAGGYR